MPAPDGLRLLTFAPMVDSETVRLLCRWYGLDHVEEDHLFGWASLLTLLHGGYGRIPLLYGSGVRLTGPRALVAHCDPLAPPLRRLIPSGLDAARAEADWQAYNGSLAVDVAVFAYFHLLPERELMTPVFAASVPAAEARLTPRAYPLLRRLFTTLLRLTSPRAEAAGNRIRTVFAALDRRLADGRRFLDGDRPTLGDMAFAGAAAPLLQPIGYGARMPEVGAMPSTIRRTIMALREQPTGAYLQRVYSRVGPAAGAVGRPSPPR